MNVCEAASKRWLKHLFGVEKNIYAQAKIINLYMICSNSVKKFLSNYLCTLHWHVFTNALH